jgi:hypothetical protein
MKAKRNALDAALATRSDRSEQDSDKS